MKALTIKQPYAHFVACGIKDIENRTWKTKYRGRILIHAGGTMTKGGYDQLTDIQKHVVRFCKGDKGYLSAIIGCVEIVDCVKNHPSIWAEKGKWNWVLANPIMFKNPIPNVKGMLSLWEYKGETPTLNTLHESIVYTEAKRSAYEMLEKLTIKEQMQVSFAPLVYTHIAWEYAFKAIECAKEDRVECVKKLCRSIKDTHQKHMELLRKDLDYDHIKHIETQSNKVLSEINMDMLKLYFAVNNEFKRIYPNEKYDRMRTYSIIGELVISLLIEHNQDMLVMLKKKLQRSNIEPEQIMYSTQVLLDLLTEMSSIGNDFNFENQSIQIGLSVIKKRIQGIEFKTLNHN